MRNMISTYLIVSCITLVLFISDPVFGIEEDSITSKAVNINQINVLSVPGTNSLKIWAELKIMAVARYDDGSSGTITSTATWSSLSPSIAGVIDYSDTAKLVKAYQTGTVTITAEKNGIKGQLVLQVLGNFILDNDYIMPNLSPPRQYMDITGGSCGETCVWAILNDKGINASQQDINTIGGSPGRGLYLKEIYTVLDYYGIQYTKYKKSVGSASSYESVLRNDIVPKIISGHPMLLGIKYMPNPAPLTSADHYVLIVGYNEVTDEIIYNDMNQRNRSKIKKLSDGSDGYTLYNAYYVVEGIEFTNISGRNKSAMPWIQLLLNN
ncbi:MAG: C39 family peptidase [Desulfobacterales bacterium]|nr:C39 family peptidase [Desulfobacterales bacterium]